jgi:Protein phosphatase 2C
VLNLDGHPDRGFFGIFDGHGGAQVAKFCAKYMPDLFLRSAEYKRGDIEAALVAAYLGIDEKLRDPANAEELNRMKAKSSANSNGTGLESVDQHESVGSGASLEIRPLCMFTWSLSSGDTASAECLSCSILLDIVC